MSQKDQEAALGRTARRNSREPSNPGRRRVAWSLVLLLVAGLVLVLVSLGSSPDQSPATVETARTAPATLTPTAIGDAEQDADPQTDRSLASTTPHVGGVLETFTSGQEVRVVCKMWCTPEWADLGERLIAPDTFEQWIIDRDARVRVDWGYGETIVEVSGGLVSRCRVGGKPTRVIRGSVRTAEGQPLAGMTVWTYEHRGLLPDVQTSTDANGRWSLGLGSQAAVITCNGPGYTCVREFRLPEGDATPEVDLVARPLTGSLTGVCVDLSGRPVAQALVYADGGALDQDAMPHALAVSQKDGTFELAVPPTGWPRHCELITSKHGWALWTRDLHSIDAGQPLTIVMGPSQKVQGRLLREDGSPFPGATVFVEGLSSSTLAENRRDWTTDASGGWVMDRIDGVVELRAMDSEYRHLCGRVVQGADWDAEEIVLWARPRADAWWVSVRAGSLAETGDCIVAHQHGGDVQHCTSPRTFWVTGEANQPTELSLMRGDQVLARQNVLGDVSKRLTDVWVFDGQGLATVALVKPPRTPSLRWTCRNAEHAMSGAMEQDRAEFQVPIGQWNVEWTVAGIPAGQASVDAVAERATTIECTGLDDWRQVSMGHEGPGTIVWRTANAVGFVDHRGGPILIPGDGTLSISFQGTRCHANLQATARSTSQSLEPTQIANPCVLYTAAAQEDAVLETGALWFGLRGVAGSSVSVPEGTYQVLVVRAGRLEQRGEVTVQGGATRPLVLH